MAVPLVFFSQCPHLFEVPDDGHVGVHETIHTIRHARFLVAIELACRDLPRNTFAETTVATLVSARRPDAADSRDMGNVRIGETMDCALDLGFLALIDNELIEVLLVLGGHVLERRASFGRDIETVHCSVS
nr:hypothetical protein CFP56_34840 [Quercus suber]